MQNTFLLSNFRNYVNAGYGLFAILLLLWMNLPRLIWELSPTSGGIDPAIWLLILLGIISFMMLTALSWWLLKKSWLALGLPQLVVMVMHFRKMEIWQQLGFYWASFALLLLAGSICLSAIC